MKQLKIKPEENSNSQLYYPCIVFDVSEQAPAAYQDKALRELVIAVEPTFDNKNVGAAYAKNGKYLYLGSISEAGQYSLKNLIQTFSNVYIMLDKDTSIEPKYIDAFWL